MLASAHTLLMKAPTFFSGRSYNSIGTFKHDPLTVLIMPGFVGAVIGGPTAYSLYFSACCGHAHPTRVVYHI